MINNKIEQQTNPNNHKKYISRSIKKIDDEITSSFIVQPKSCQLNYEASFFEKNDDNKIEKTTLNKSYHESENSCSKLNFLCRQVKY